MVSVLARHGESIEARHGVKRQNQLRSSWSADIIDGWTDEISKAVGPAVFNVVDDELARVKDANDADRSNGRRRGGH